MSNNINSQSNKNNTSKQGLVDSTSKNQIVQQIKQTQIKETQQQNLTNKGQQLKPNLQENLKNQKDAKLIHQMQNKQSAQKNEDKKENLKLKQDQYLENLLQQIEDNKSMQLSEKKVDKKTNKIYTLLQYGRINIIGQNHRKLNIVEDDIIEKKIMDAQKLKDQLRNQLSHIDQRLENLSSQRIDNPKSLYSHPVLKQYLETDEERKQQQASRFIKKVKSQQAHFAEQLKQKIEELEYKKKIEDAQAQRLIIQQKQNSEKEREERLKRQIKIIKERKDLRIKQLNEFEEIYKKKIKKDQSKRPLYIRLIKKYNMKEQYFKEITLKEKQEKRKQYLQLAKIDFKQHEKNYFENLQKLEQIKKQNREKQLLELQKKQPEPNLIYDSSKLLKNEIVDNQYNKKLESESIQRENAYKIVEARTKFSNALKQHQQVSPSKQKQLEMDIIIDKSANPHKYITQVKKKNENDRYQEYLERGKLVRKKSADFSVRKSASTMSILNARSFQTPQMVSKNALVSQDDEMIFKQQQKVGFIKQEPGKERELGNLYLKSIRESSRKYQEYLNQRKLLTESNSNGKLMLDMIDDSYQKDTKGPFSPINTSSSHQQTLKSTQNSKLPLISNKQLKNKELGNSYSQQNINSQIDNIARGQSSDKYSITNQDTKSNSNSEKNEKKEFKKYNYMSEIREKYNLDQRKEKWEQINDSKQAVPILEKKKLLEEAYYKYDKEIMLKEQVVRSHRPQELSLKEVQDRQNLDDAYLKSIKAKLEMMKLTIDNDQFVKKEQPQVRKMVQNQEQYYNQY
ncbi:hypothetical protein ABPG74_017389 [Tetrahymena malaccensis]